MQKNLNTLNQRTKDIVDPTIIDMRRFIFEQMKKLSSGEISIHEGTVQAKLAHQIMDGYKTQVRLLEIADLASLNEKDIITLTASMDNSHV